ncbi:MAG: hypothetical protein ACI8TX_003611 [Hyphomicrobiaceae bacterium]|jgi:hypothetical protein
MSYAPIYPHDPIEEIMPDVFMARGRVPLNKLLTLSRNMAIVRHDGELTLVNSVRLDAAGEKRLRELGEVKRILRLGPFHGMDDAYYIDTFGAQLWTPGDSSAYAEPKADCVFDETTPLPFPDAEIYCFKGTSQPESMLLINREGGLLLSCDGIQNYGDYSNNNFLARTLMPWIGFARTTILGPFWLKLMTPEGESLEAEFREFLSRRFENLLSAHGTFLRGGAHAAVATAIDNAFKKKG